MIAAERVPIVLLDLDETLNRHFGASIEECVVNSLQNLSKAGGLFGLNTGADIFWAGERVLHETDPLFSFPFLLLATGKQIYAWVTSLMAYVLLPIQAENKGQAMSKLAEYLKFPLDQSIFIGDFPGAGEGQEGIDDPVLREQIGIIINVGMYRKPEQIKPLFPETLILHPEYQGERMIGTGYEATIQYLACFTEVFKDESIRNKIETFRSKLMSVIEQKLNIGILSSPGAQIWTLEKPVQEVGSCQSVLIRAKRPGMVHAGVNHHGEWIRIYDVPLKEVSPGLWEASLLDPDVNVWTFIWYDPNRSGNGYWEGKNYHLKRAPPSLSKTFPLFPLTRGLLHAIVLKGAIPQQTHVHNSDFLKPMTMADRPSSRRNSDSSQNRSRSGSSPRSRFLIFPDQQASTSSELDNETRNEAQKRFKVFLDEYRICLNDLFKCNQEEQDTILNLCKQEFQKRNENGRQQYIEDLLNLNPRQQLELAQDLNPRQRSRFYSHLDRQQRLELYANLSPRHQQELNHQQQLQLYRNFNRQQRLVFYLRLSLQQQRELVQGLDHNWRLGLYQDLNRQKTSRALSKSRFSAAAGALPKSQFSAAAKACSRS